jgi:hypothetical protein
MAKFLSSNSRFRPFKTTKVIKLICAKSELKRSPIAAPSRRQPFPNWFLPAVFVVYFYVGRSFAMVSALFNKPLCSGNSLAGTPVWGMNRIK